MKNAEAKRLELTTGQKENWKLWGPYLSERSWGTVREDYGTDGDAWNFLTHEHARSKAYRWGEDGIGGISDLKQRLCLAFAFWNGNDPILKERLFGLSNAEGNHGEDVKELYYYLDSTPTHSWMKFLYRYPHAAFPYEELRKQNAGRSKSEPEFELWDTGVLNEGRYFDIVIEYAKEGPEDILIELTAFNRGPEEATLHVLPHLWFRNTWSWVKDAERPSIVIGERNKERIELFASGEGMQHSTLHIQGSPELLFTDNDSNDGKMYGGPDRSSPYCKDAFHEAVVHGRKEFLRPLQIGTKAAAHFVLKIPAGGLQKVQLRLAHHIHGNPFHHFETIVRRREKEADEFYAGIHSPNASEEERSIQRQAWAGLLWSKQFYYFHVNRWLKGDLITPPADRARRNIHWRHFRAEDVLLMPDKWEYPWFAAWDLAFQCVAVSRIDLQLAKEQILLLLSENYMHPNGDTPAYEWEFSDANPPIEAWAVWELYEREKLQMKKGDLSFLKRAFLRLMINFTYWVNRKDDDDNNVFEGGFLGLDNISVFDRSEEAPGGGQLDQTDGTAWMGLYCLTMMKISVELAVEGSPEFAEMAIKFFRHFLYIADAMTKMGPDRISMWNDEDGFFYDLLRFPDGRIDTVRIRSVAGLIPLVAVATLDDAKLKKIPEFKDYLDTFTLERQDLLGDKVEYLCQSRDHCSRLLSLVGLGKLKRILERVLNEGGFLSPYGIRSLSKTHQLQPLICGDGRLLTYEPAESTSRLKGGNSNWRGPIWFPVNFILIRALRTFHSFIGDQLKVEFPSGSGNQLSLDQVANELCSRLTDLFRKKDGSRPAMGRIPNPSISGNHADGDQKAALLFHEYFNAETGEGLGSNHQTGWTALVAELMI
ncbi:MAG: glucosidase [Planctomycetota bacterium]|nr:glucosidase [Planctomycetota bacterium]MDA1142719.1 glucosidase [Planctomycetota bacterium]